MFAAHAEIPRAAEYYGPMTFRNRDGLGSEAPCGPRTLRDLGPMRLKIVEQGCVAHSIGEPMGTNGRAMVTQGDPWGPWGRKIVFCDYNQHTNPVRHNSNLTLLKPTKQTRLNVDQSKRDSNLRHLASVRDWMLEPKGVQSTTSSKPLLSNAASVRDWVLQGSLLETQCPAVGATRTGDGASDSSRRSFDAGCSQYSRLRGDS